MPSSLFRQPILRPTFLILFAAGLLSGCVNGALPANVIPLSGNWQFSAPTSAVTGISGTLSGNNFAAQGTVHTDRGVGCSASSTAVAVRGATNAEGILTLTGNLAGGTLTVTGLLAQDGHSLSNASYGIVGGTCATPKTEASAQMYSPIEGNFAGSFSDPNGQVISITAALSQTPDADTDGNFQLNGSATLPSNPCFNSPVPITDSQVTGGSFTFTYTDSVTTNSVTATGTFSSDGKTLTVTNWQSSGPCGPDAGTGLMTKS